MKVACPRCGTQVWLSPNGICPACREDTGIEVRREATAAVSRPKTSPAEAEEAELISESDEQPNSVRRQTNRLVPCKMCGELISPNAPDCVYCGEGRHPQGGHGRVWRHGNILLIARGVELPNRCIKTNGPADVRLRRNLAWVHPTVYLLLLLNLLICLIVALSLRKKAVLEIPISREALSRRGWAIFTAWLIALAGVGLFIFGIARESLELVGTGVLGMLGGLIYGIVCGSLVRVKKIDPETIQLTGIHPEYLAQFPMGRRR